MAVKKNKLTLNYESNRINKNKFKIKSKKMEELKFKTEEGQKITFYPFDKDGEINVETLHDDLYLTRYQVKKLIEFLTTQIEK